MDFSTLLKRLVQIQFNLNDDQEIRSSAQYLLNAFANLEYSEILNIHEGSKRLPFELRQHLGYLADKNVIRLDDSIFKTIIAKNSINEEIATLEVKFHINQIQNVFKKNYLQEKVITFSEDFTFAFHSLFITLKNRGLLNDVNQPLFSLNKILEGLQTKPLEIPFLNSILSELKKIKSDYKKTKLEDLQAMASVIKIYRDLNNRTPNVPNQQRIKISEFTNLFRSIFNNLRTNLVLPNILYHSTLHEAKVALSQTFPDRCEMNKRFDETLIIHAKIITEEKAKFYAKNSDGSLNEACYFKNKQIIARHLVLNIEERILSEEWPVNFRCFNAGVTISYKTASNETKTKVLPKTLYLMFTTIQYAKITDKNNIYVDWSAVYDKVAYFAKEAATHKSTFLGKQIRDPYLQQFYECFSKSFVEAQKYQHKYKNKF